MNYLVTITLSVDTPEGSLFFTEIYVTSKTNLKFVSLNSKVNITNTSYKPLATSDLALLTSLGLNHSVYPNASNYVDVNGEDLEEETIELIKAREALKG